MNDAPTPFVDLIAGARPNFMKVSSIIRALEVRRNSGARLGYRLIHTGQHYDERMSGLFFSQLRIPQPQINLEVGSGTQAEQVAAIMRGYEALLFREPASLCLVVGDVNSTMACAITAQKCGVPVAHVEAGIRSNDWRMPEEINRLVTDAVTNYFFTTSTFANENLHRSGVADEQIFFVGNTMIDTLLANIRRFRPPTFWLGLGLKPRNYLLLTLHRPSNVDTADILRAWLTTMCAAAFCCPVIFPVHPRTLVTLRAIGDLPPNLKLVEPQAYLEFGYLMQNAKAVITDSGGISEETTVLGVPCLTLRDSTERPETVMIGTNELIGTDPSGLRAPLERLFAGHWKLGGTPPLWDGRAAERIVEALLHLDLSQPQPYGVVA